VTALLEELLRLGVKVAVITGTNFNNIDRQFSSLIKGTHKQNLFVCANRGSEVYGFNRSSQPRLRYRRRAKAAENRLLDSVAEAVKADIEASSSVGIEIVYDRLNRRKIDLIPEWQNPPKSRIGELIKKTDRRLRDGGFKEGIRGAYELAIRYSRELGLGDARLTSDVKHIEVGLTDKSDSVKWILSGIATEWNIREENILVLGDEFGPIAGFEGSDFHMVLPGHDAITYLSVGKEPNGVPGAVIRFGGGPRCFRELIGRQVDLHRRLALTTDESFLLIEDGFNPFREREIESLASVSNGYLGTRASLEEQGPASGAATLIAGIYDIGEYDGLEELATAPDWLFTRIFVFGKQLKLDTETMVEHKRILDLRRGVYRRRWRHRDHQGRMTSVEFTRFVSMDDPHALVLTVSITPENYSGAVRVETGIRVCDNCRTPLEPVGGIKPARGRKAKGERGEDSLKDKPRPNSLNLLTGTSRSGLIVSMAQATRVHEDYPGVIKKERYIDSGETDAGVYEEIAWHAEMDRALTLQKYVSVFTSRETDEPAAAASAHAAEIAGRGATRLLLEHTSRWEERWELSGIDLEGDPEARHLLNFSIYHLIGAGNPGDDRVSVSARALTGTIYRGHIFWDAEIFTIPFFIFTFPPAARAALMYRYHTLPAAKNNATKAGFRGAMFAWESAQSGEEMTPRAMLSPSGEVIPVTSGDLEDHIISDIAYGVWRYWSATGDDAFLIEAGAELILETARFWVSRSEHERGAYHILNVEGPDEYHDEGVDDNYYTNAMAVWNIEHALEAALFMQESYPAEWAELSGRIGLKNPELKQWSKVADQMYLNMTGGKLIEEFSGYFNLEDIDVRDFRPRTAPMAVILGRDRANASQIVKQADVVMALYLLEKKLSPEIIRANFEYYDRRTAHGSSLSPAIYGLVAARLGMLDEALAYFRQAATIDLANNMGNAAGGVHIAAMGGLWQEMIMGFAGVRTDGARLFVNPILPDGWKRLRFRLAWRGLTLAYDIRSGRQIRLTLEGTGKVQTGIYGSRPQELTAPGTYVSSWADGAWRDFILKERKVKVVRKAGHSSSS
ncbi:MAG: hypothetical protein M1455_10835, partial [Actinobacteria bacterium]|nr:hypothetical protein [Actinomycetota bacterium]